MSRAAMSIDLSTAEGRAAARELRQRFRMAVIGAAHFAETQRLSVADRQAHAEALVRIAAAHADVLLASASAVEEADASDEDLLGYDPDVDDSAVDAQVDALVGESIPGATFAALSACGAITTTDAHLRRTTGKGIGEE